MPMRWVTALFSLAAISVAASSAEAGCDRPAKVTQVKAVVLAMNVIELTWTSAGPYYDLFIRDASNNKPSEAGGDVTGGLKGQNAYTFRNLHPNTEYRFALRARTESNNGGCVSAETSDWAVARTPSFETDQTCKTYALAAGTQLAAMKAKNCPAPPPRWDPNPNAHYLFCLADIAGGHTNYVSERKARDDAIAACQGQAQAAGAAPNCAPNAGDPVPSQWADMLNAHNVRRKLH